MIPQKYRIHAFLILVALLIIFIPRIAEHPDKEKAAAAKAAAEKFLHLVDAGQFAASWQAAAPALQQKVPEEKWVDQLKRTREVTGPLVDRSQSGISYSPSVENSPEGEYILIVYDSNFKNRKGLTENVTVMLDKNKSWRVGGYFIK